MATLRVAIDASRARAGAAQARTALRTVGASAAQAGGRIRKFDASLTGVGRTAGLVSRQLRQLLGGFTAFIAIRSTINVLRSFGETMAFVRAIAIDVNDTLENQARTFARLEEVTRELGATTRFTATQAAEGMLALSRAGFDANETIAALPLTLSLATAGMLDLGSASDLVAVTLRQFGLAAEETERVADVLLNTANNSTTTVAELGEAMKFAGAFAGQLGISLEETAAAMGVMANAGLRGSLAGTALRQILVGLIKPTKQSRDQIAALGLTMADVNVSTLGVVEVFQRLAKAGAGPAQLARIFRVTAVTGAAALIKAADAFKDFSENIVTVQGTAQRTADIVDDELNGAILQLKSAIESVQLSMTGFKDALREVIEFATLVARTFDDISDSEQGVTQAAKNVGAAITILVSALSSLIALRLIRFLTVAIFNFKRLFLVIAANPIGALITLLGVAVGALIAFKDEAGLTGLSFGRAFKLIGVQVEITLAQIGNFATKTVSFFDALFTAIGRFFSGEEFITPPAQELELVDLDALKRQRRELVALISGRNQEIIESSDDLFDAQLRFGRALEETSLRVSRFFDEVTQSANQPELFEAFDRLNDALAGQATALRLTGAERENFINSLQAEQDLIEAAKPRMEELNEALKLQGDILENVRLRREALRALIVTTEALRGPSAVAELEAEFALLTAELELAEEALGDLQRIRELSIANIRQAIEQTAEAIEELQKLKDLEALADDIGNAFASNLGSMLDGFARVTSEAENAREAFKDMGEVAIAALEDIIRSIIKLIIQQALIKPLAGAITGVVVGLGSEKGNVFQGGRLQTFASGGVITSPAVFPMANGGIGLAGEAGPEGILPLRRGADGKLGVIAQGGGGGQTIINQTFNISTPDANSFRKSERQLAERARRQLGRST